MGMTRFGPPKELILLLKHSFSLNTFIETGTYRGDTAVWAASHFKDVVTIEYSKSMHNQAVAKYGALTPINFIFGDSRLILDKMISDLTEPVFFWLDAHWSGGHTWGEKEQCPLIGELEAINRSKIPHFVFIDDARLFTSPPPLPNCLDQWPTIDQVIQVIRSRQERVYIVIFEDVIMAVPPYAKEVVAHYCQKSNTESWKKYGNHSMREKVSDLIKGEGFLVHNIKSMSLGVYRYLQRMVSCIRGVNHQQ